MPEMQEIRSIMGYPDPHQISAQRFSPTPSSQMSQASEDNLIASPTDGTISSMVGDSSAASSKITTPVTSRKNSNHRPKQVALGEIEMVDVVGTREPKRHADVINGVDTEAINRTLDKAGSRIVTMTGTIKRGGQKADEAVHVQLKLSQNEIDKLNAKMATEEDKKPPCCGLKQGLHILLFTFLFTPIAFIISFCMSFYLGTQAWYNLYLYLSEERTIWHKVFLSPLLIIFFPFLILLFSLGIGLWGMIKQISWYFSSWVNEMRDPDKGFYSWLFNLMNVPQCSPFQVVILDEPTPKKGQISTPTTDL